MTANNNRTDDELTMRNDDYLWYGSGEPDPGRRQRGLDGAAGPAAVARAHVRDGGDAGPGQLLQLPVQGGHVGLHHGDVMGFLLARQPGQVGPDRVESVEGHHGAVQVQGFQQRGKVAGLVVLTPTSR